MVRPSVNSCSQGHASASFYRSIQKIVNTDFSDNSMLHGRLDHLAIVSHSLQTRWIAISCVCSLSVAYQLSYEFPARIAFQSLAQSIRYKIIPDGIPAKSLTATELQREGVDQSVGQGVPRSPRRPSAARRTGHLKRVVQGIAFISLNIGWLPPISKVYQICVRCVKRGSKRGLRCEYELIYAG